MELTWLTTKMAAEYLGTTPKAILNKVHSGELNAHKYGSHNRYTKKDLDDLIKKPLFTSKKKKEEEGGDE